MGFLKLVGGTDVDGTAKKMKARKLASVPAPAVDSSEPGGAMDAFANDPLAILFRKGYLERVAERAARAERLGPARPNPDEAADDITRKIILALPLGGASVRALIAELNERFDIDNGKLPDDFMRQQALINLLQSIGITAVMTDPDWGLSTFVACTVSEPKKMLKAIPVLKKGHASPYGLAVY